MTTTVHTARGAVVTIPGPHKGLRDAARTSRTAGFHFFDPDTMAWWRSKLEGGLHAGRLFITSEQYGDGEPRRYTLRAVLDTGQVQTVGTFQQFPTYATALQRLNGLLVAAEDAADPDTCPHDETFRDEDDRGRQLVVCEQCGSVADAPPRRFVPGYML